MNNISQWLDAEASKSINTIKIKIDKKIIAENKRKKAQRVKGEKNEKDSLAGVK